MIGQLAGDVVALQDRWQPYPTYKDSTVEWLAQMPQHWGTRPLKRMAGVAYRGFTDGDWIESPYITEDGIRLIQTGNIGIGRYREQGFRYIDDDTFDTLRCTEVAPGDVLICRLAAPVGRACLAPDLGVRMITSVDVAILKLSANYDGRYVVYCLSSKPYLDWMQSVCRGGTRDRVSRSMLGSAQIPVPPFPEERAIADFLDCETAKIDMLIAKNARLIELLQEKRAALITRAVTKGLDLHAAMKDSGVEWLGEIPAHWEVSTLKRIGRIGAGSGFPHDEQGSMDEALPFFKVSDMNLPENQVLMQQQVNTVSLATARRLGAEVFPSDTIVFPKVGAALLTNKRRILARDSCLDNNIMALIPGHVQTRYLYHFLSCLDLGRLANPGAVPSVNKSQVHELPTLSPPFREQRAIAVFLDRETARIEAFVQRVQQVIEKLQEYRSALITAAVTGQIDVREEVAK